jgi:hypothetical protein
VPRVEGAECEDLDDCEAGGVNGFQFATAEWGGQLLTMQLDPFLRLSLSAKNLADLAIDLGGILSGFRNQRDPLLSMRWHFQLAEQVGSLHDGFDGIAEIVNQFAQLIGDFGRKFLRVVHHRPARERIRFRHSIVRVCGSVRV